MHRFPESTPCPISASDQFLTRTAQETDTQTINFTRNLQAAFRQAAPRRRPGTTTRRGNWVVEVFEDEKGNDGTEINNGLPNGGMATRTTTGTTKAAGRGKDATALGRRDTMGAAPVRATRRAPASRPVATVDCHEMVETAGTENNAPLRKEPRRRTIYVPSEDTTVLTIHPGMKNAGEEQTADSLQLLQDLGNRLGEVDDHGPSRRTKSRRSLAAAPKRVPLQPTLSRVQENAPMNYDMPGRLTGKENVPPAGLCMAGKKMGLGECPIATGKVKILGEVNGSRQRRTSMVAIIKRPASASIRIGTFSNGESDFRQKALKQDREEKSTASGSIASSAEMPSRKSPNTVPDKMVKPVLKLPEAVRPQYPLLQEDISQPQMFEELWLSNQETAITELINSLFATANPVLARPKPSLKVLRHNLIELYQSPPMVLLFKRLKASLLYGALSSPNDTVPEAARLMNDLAVRRRFLHLWMRTYNLDALRAAAEVVIGRQILHGSTSPPGRRTCGSNEVEAFIESCLLKNLDGLQAVKFQTNSVLWSWRRTMQRSLMLINLLDKSKEIDIIPTRLFRKTAVHKSSSSILQELVALLVPWGGDLRRALGHLDYQTVHVQYPLSEYDYIIQNPAADLRDGVRLTHLVELLLYPPSQLATEPNKTTFLMPLGESLTSSAEGHSFGVLSQHLKFPCQGRALRLFNTQIALSALHGVKGVAGIAESIRAEDIVDGHREKTMIMLWGLVGNWGLECLVDKGDLKNEIHRLQKCSNNHDNEDKPPAPNLENQKHLLRAWAGAVASKHGLAVRNLTTSFADGKVFECLVGEYQRYFGPQGAFPADMPLEMKLRKLGCSTSFASIFGRTAHAEQLFDQDFTVAALAYFSSRLLGASRKRRKLAYLAHDCMMVVLTRNNVIAAATTIQRAWRAHLSRKAVCVAEEEGDPSDIWLV